MNYPVYVFAKDAVVSTFETMFQEMSDGWWAKPFYFGAGLVIDFKGGLVQKLIYDANANPGNAERLYLSDVMSGRVAPYNPIASMSRICKDELLADIIVDMFVSVYEEPVSKEVRTILAGALAIAMCRCRNGDCSYGLPGIEKAVVSVFEQRELHAAASCVRSIFSPLHLSPYSQILGGAKPGLTAEVALTNKMIYVLDASAKRMDEFLVPTRDAGLCEYNPKAVSLLAGLLILDFWQNLIDLYQGASLRYTPLTLMVNGMDFLPELPLSEMFTDMVSVGAKGFLVQLKKFDRGVVRDLCSDVSVIHTSFPDLLTGKRGYAPFVQMDQYTYSLGEMSE